jgi:hypothetical protein
VLAHIRPLIQWFDLKLDISLRYHYSPALCLVSVTFKCPPLPRAPLPTQGVTSCGVMSMHNIGERYPSFIAHTGSCARPKPSYSLGINLGRKSLQIVASLRWEMAFPDIISAILV